MSTFANDTNVKPDMKNTENNYGFSALILVKSR